MSSSKKQVIIIGAGLGGLALAAMLQTRGYSVTVLEKNSIVGGRAGKIEASGYRFDTGPSWYLMPDFFEHFFETIGEDIEDHLNLKKLSPSYRVFFKDAEQASVDIHSDFKKDAQTFGQMESGADEALQSYLQEAGEIYELSKEHFIYRNYDSFFDFFDPEVIRYGSQIPALFQKAHSRVSQYFKNPSVQKLIEYAFLFLGTDPRDAPAVYSVMNHVDYEYGVYYPEGGIYEIVESLRAICEQSGVEIHTDTPVQEIIVENGRSKGVVLENGERVEADMVISNADRHYTDTQLLPDRHQEFSKRYWQSRKLSPSAFLMYLGVDGELPELTHHNFVFSEDWEQNFDEIFNNDALPSDPSFYICNPSVTDTSVAPDGKENLYVLVPIAPDISLDDSDIAAYKKKILATLGDQIGAPELENRIEFEETFTVQDFKRRFNSYKGSALGLNHTLLQSAYFRPNNVHSTIDNLYFVGAGTNPGIGMPMVLASAELAYKRIEGIGHAQPMDPIEKD